MEPVELLALSIVAAATPLMTRLVKALIEYVSRNKAIRFKIEVGGVPFEFSIGDNAEQAVKEITDAVKRSPSRPPSSTAPL